MTLLFLLVALCAGVLLILFRFFGMAQRCKHRHLSWPIRPKGTKQDYLVCLDCGATFSYDWELMQVGGQIR